MRIGAYEGLPAEENVDDAITVSHVIEQVHEHNSLLRAVNRVSKPGGIVSIETSNIDSLGAVRFGKSWRGIEEPRDFVLLNPSSLSRMQSEAGLDDLVKIRRTAPNALTNANFVEQKAMAFFR